MEPSATDTAPGACAATADGTAPQVHTPAVEDEMDERVHGNRQT